MTTEKMPGPFTEEWVHRELRHANDSAAHQRRIDIRNNLVPDWLRERFSSPPEMIEGAHGVEFAVREFFNGQDAPGHWEINPDLPPIIFFTHWGCALNGERGLLDTYGLLQELEPSRPLITVEIPGHGEASAANWRWLRGLTYERLGLEIADVLARSEINDYPQRIHLSGISSGGNMAVAVASAIGARARSVTAVSAPGDSRILLPRFGHAFAAVERRNLDQSIYAADPEVASRIQEIEATEINSQEDARTTKALLFGKLAVGMANASLLKNIRHLHPDTQLHLFCGSNEAVVDWKKQLALARNHTGKSTVHIEGSAHHARLAVNRLEPGVQIGITVRRVDGTLRQ